MFQFIFLLTILTKLVGSAAEWKYKFTTVDHIRDYGYPVEVHYIITTDGYILTTYRIPYGIKCNETQSRKSPVILWHAMTGCSIDYVSNIDGLGFMLADDCYDVWMPNTRGTAESNSNVGIQPDQKEFWAFSWHEVGVYDVSAVVNYVTSYTKIKRLFYVGFSEGNTAFFVYASLYPEEAAEKVMYMQAIGTAAFLNNTFNPLIRIAVRFLKKLQVEAIIGVSYSTVPVPDVKKTFSSNKWGPARRAIVKFFGINQFLPTGGVLHRIQYNICQINLLGNFGLCANLFFFPVIGPDYINFNSDLLPNITVHDSAGTSIRTAIHYAQVIKSGHFRQYDFEDGNLEKYGSSEPPSYPIENINVPMKLYYGHKDWIASPVDVKRFANATKSELVDCGYINHGDFVWAKNVRTLINEPIIATFNDFLMKNVGFNKTNLN